MRVGKLRKIWCCLDMLLVISGCDSPLTQNDLEALLARGEIVLITRNNSACYYEGPHGPVGFEYDLAKAFADHLGVTLRVSIIEDEIDMIVALKAGQGDILAPGAPFGGQSARLLSLGPRYLEVEQQVVGRRGGPDIQSKKALEAYTACLEIYEKVEDEWGVELERIFKEVYERRYQLLKDTPIK